MTSTTGAPSATQACRKPAGAAGGRRGWRRRRGWRISAWLAAFLVFFTLSATWALATPLFSGPDEPSQYVRAAAVVRGEFGGPVRLRPIWPYYSYVHYTLPKQIVRTEIEYGPYCGLGNVQVPASCHTPLPWPDVQPSESYTPYNPTYFALVGLPTLLDTGRGGVYGARLVSALLCSALMATGFAALRRAGSRSLLTLGALVSATPTVTYFNGVINASGLEISAAFALWCTLLPLTGPGVRPSPRTIALLVFLASVLAISRPLSPFWLVAILGCCAVRLGWRRLIGLTGHRLTWCGLLGLAPGILFAAVWDAFGGTVGTTGILNPYWTFGVAARHTYDLTTNLVTELVGGLQWLDGAPLALLWLWAMALGLLVLAACALARRRELAVMAGIVLFVLVFPIVFQGIVARYYEPLWEGRYQLPVALGLPLLAAVILAERAGGLPRTVTARACAMTALLLGIATAVNFWWVQRRNAVGLSGALFPVHPLWSPPMGWSLAWVMEGAGLVGLGALVAASARADRRTEAASRLVPMQAATLSGPAATGQGSSTA
jgi:hypothetical protein